MAHIGNLYNFFKVGDFEQISGYDDLYFMILNWRDDHVVILEVILSIVNIGF